MKLTGNTILITGGGSGIGLAFAQRFLQAGNEVIICGRRADQLKEAKSRFPLLHTVEADVATEQGRVALFNRINSEFPKINVLVNNAGIQNRLPPFTEPQEWAPYHNEISINLEAPMHLALLFVPLFMKQPDAAILNITSGLSFLPISFMPGYCATKAAMHSFTLSLRHQLKATSVKVVEIIPPAVQTDLGGKGLHDSGVPLDEFADYTFVRLAKGDLEFGYGFSEKGRLASREQLDVMFKAVNQ